MVHIGDDWVGKTISGAKIVGQGNDLAIDLSEIYKPTQPGAYPIILASYEIVCSKYPDPEVGKAVKAFLQATITTGQTDLKPDRLHSAAPGLPIASVHGRQRHQPNPLRAAEPSDATQGPAGTHPLVLSPWIDVSSRPLPDRLSWIPRPGCRMRCRSGRRWVPRRVAPGWCRTPQNRRAPYKPPTSPRTAQ